MKDQKNNNILKELAEKIDKLEKLVSASSKIDDLTQKIERMESMFKAFIQKEGKTLTPDEIEAEIKRKYEDFYLTNKEKEVIDLFSVDDSLSPSEIAKQMKISLPRAFYYLKSLESKQKVKKIRKGVFILYPKLL